METKYEIGLIINGEFYPLEISQTPKDIIDTDPPYVGHTQQSRKVTFEKNENGKVIIIQKRWGVDVTDIGNIPPNIISELIN